MAYVKSHGSLKSRLARVGIVALLLLSLGFETQAFAVVTTTPIKHVIIIVQENHTFFNYFGGFPGVAGGVADAICMPRLKHACLSPFPIDSETITGTLGHNAVPAAQSYDNGSMDGFLKANNNSNVMSYYTNGTTLGYYWGLASHYTLFDMFFSSYMTYSSPNHWAAVAGAAPPITFDHPIKQDNATTTELIQQASIIQTMLEFVQAYSRISAKYYDTPVQYHSITQAIERGGDKYVVNLFNPSLVKADTYTTLRSDFVPRTNIFSDIANGKLPSISWVIPVVPISEHPPYNTTRGVQWVKSIISAVMDSQYWSTTAIFYMTDDWGGFYDPVAPPSLDGQVLGFRVAAMMISPYASHAIDNTQYSFESILHFIDYNWNLPFLDQRVADANNMLTAFNFNQSPLAPWFSTSLTQSQMQDVLAGASQDAPEVD